MEQIKIYRTVVQYEILSPEPVNFESLTGIAYSCTDGDCVGRFLDDIINNQELTGEVAVNAIKEAGSEPEFFNMNDY